MSRHSNYIDSETVTLTLERYDSIVNAKTYIEERHWKEMEELKVLRKYAEEKGLAVYKIFKNENLKYELLTDEQAKEISTENNTCQKINQY